jgi:NAD(P)-dependent dehydrogenase (short-subunit alcohol dehydrogenase family)
VVLASPAAGGGAGSDARAGSAQPNLGADQIMTRIAAPREIGYVALFLASDEASFMTGANVTVDAGWTAL